MKNTSTFTRRNMLKSSVAMGAYLALSGLSAMAQAASQGGFTHQNQLAIPPLNPSLRMPWEILVNSKGERFVREDHPSIDHIEKQLAKQPGHRHWAIFDANTLEQAPPLIDGWDAQAVRDACNDHPMFSAADSIGELAVRAGVHPRNLQTTIEA